MKTIKIMIACICICFFANNDVWAQWAVIDGSNLAQAISHITQTKKVVTNSMDSFKETVKLYEQGKEYYDALKAVNNLVKDAKKVQKTILMVQDITEIYITNYQLMLSDPNFSADELNAIGFGYTELLNESADIVTELKEVITPSSLSLSDKERMEVIDNCHEAMKEQRALTEYYTRKNISVSYLRAKKIDDQERVVSLYGNSERYW